MDCIWTFCESYCILLLLGKIGVKKEYGLQDHGNL